MVRSVMLSILCVASYVAAVEFEQTFEMEDTALWSQGALDAEMWDMGTDSRRNLEDYAAMGSAMIGSAAYGSGWEMMGEQGAFGSWSTMDGVGASGSAMDWEMMGSAVVMGPSMGAYGSSMGGGGETWEMESSSSSASVRDYGSSMGGGGETWEMESSSSSASVGDGMLGMDDLSGDETSTIWGRYGS